MHKNAGRIVYSPSDLIRFMESPFASFMERLHLEHPDRVTPDEYGDQDKILFKKGLEHEDRFLKSLVAEGRDVCVIDTDQPLDVVTAATRDAISARKEVIFQARLVRGDFAGYADFLVLDPASGLYEAWDTKLANKPRPYFLVQLSCYAEMLTEYQPERPGQVRVVLGTNEVRAFRTDDHFFFYRRLKQAFREQMEFFDPEAPPFPDPACHHGRWGSHAEALLEEADHLCRVANIRASQIRKLESAGVGTLTALAETDLDRVPKLDEDVLARLKEQARLQIQTATSGETTFRVIPPDLEDPRRGLACLPPPSDRDIFFDIEGYPLVEGGLEYLLGASCLEEGELLFRDFWAHDRATEKLAFESFIDWVVARRAEDPGMHVYHYAPYEVSAMRRLMGRHATREDEVDDLLRGEVFVDLYKVVREGLRIGERSYSIKDVEHLYRDRREGDVTDAGASIVFYEHWLESGDPPDWKSAPMLAAIRDYNIDDCESLVQLCDWLRDRQSEAGVEWVPPRGGVPDPSEEKELPEHVVARRALAARLIEEIPASEGDRCREADRWRVQELLAHVLEFHRREAKPVWWAMFDRAEMTTEELVEDLACLGGLTRMPGDPVAIKRSKGYWYRFDSAQDTKVGAGDGVMFAHDLDIKPGVEEMKPDGRVLLKMGPKPLSLLPGGMPRRLSLIPNEYVGTAVLEGAITDVVDGYAETGLLSGALEAFLYRRRPSIAGHGGGPILEVTDDVTDAVIRAVDRMEETTLCIQGPPGSGKTWTGSLAIQHLLEKECSVGVTSNSHKAIHNLIRAVNNRMEGALRCTKVGGPEEDELYDECPGARNLGSKAAEDAWSGGLIGGTAWFFARPGMADRLDYLFVDEAGQVSVANLIAMCRSARNIVLLGDQMQLGQPIQGSHPGESGLSVLDYLLEERATIPPDLGVFLPTTWRLHPGICDFISGAVYEDRLKPEEQTVNRVVRVPEDARLVTTDAGIVFLPVLHEGNTQASDEEVERIVELAAELEGREYTDRDGGVCGRLGIGDILFVAPYNMQVQRLRKALPDRARVASVDKFQGQEAPVVVISMCASPGEAAPRGLEFLMNRNRLNVAVSRAQSLTIVVGDPRLAHGSCSTVEDMARLNLYCRLLTAGGA